MANGERPQWRAVPDKFGAAFVRDITFPSLGLVGTEKKQIHPAGHGSLTEVLTSQAEGTKRELVTMLDTDGTPLEDKDISIRQGGSRLSLQLPVTIPDQILSYNSGLGRQSIDVAYNATSGSLTAVEYEVTAGSTLQVGDDEVRRSPRDYVTDLSAYYADRGDVVFTMAESLSFSEREITLKHRGWTDEQREQFENAINDVLDPQRFQRRYSLDDQLTDAQRQEFVTRLRSAVSGNFTTEMWSQVGSYFDLTRMIDELTISMSAEALDVRRLDQEAQAIPGARFFEFNDDSVMAEVFDRITEDTLHEERLPFNRDLKYDQFGYRLSRATDGRLILATTNFGQEGGTTWHYVPDQVDVAEVATLSEALDPKKWSQVMKRAPFVDPSISLVPKGEDPHTFLRGLALSNASIDNREQALRHMGNCPDCQPAYQRMRQLLDVIYGRQV